MNTHGYGDSSEIGRSKDCSTCHMADPVACATMIVVASLVTPALWTDENLRCLVIGRMVNLSLEGRAALVVGGGAIASRKAEDLLQAKAVVTVVAPEIGEEMVALVVQDRVRVFVRPYRSTDIGNSFVVIAATDSQEVNTAVFTDATARNARVA